MHIGTAEASVGSTSASLDERQGIQNRCLILWAHHIRGCSWVERPSRRLGSKLRWCVSCIHATHWRISSNPTELCPAVAYGSWSSHGIEAWAGHKLHARRHRYLFGQKPQKPQTCQRNFTCQRVIVEPQVLQLAETAKLLGNGTWRRPKTRQELNAVLLSQGLRNGYHTECSRNAGGLARF